MGGLTVRPQVYWTEVTVAPFGVVCIAFTALGLCSLHWGTDARCFLASVTRQMGATPRREDAQQSGWQHAIRASLIGSLATVPLDLTWLTPFQQQVLAKAMEIPRGAVRSYQWVATAIGRPRAVRAVGSALARNPVPLVVPCHRVVPKLGGLGRYSGPNGVRDKAQLLALEGAS